MDNADRAQIAEERAYARLWGNRRGEKIRPAIDDEKPYHCVDCDEIIPPQRVNLGYKIRCIECQALWEKQYPGR